MSRVITDGDLVSWEVFASGGPFGLPMQPKIVFNCLSEPGRRARYVVHDGNAASAARALEELPDQALAQLLDQASELD